MASASISQLQTTGTNLFSTFASLAGTVMLFRSVLNDMIPPQLRDYIIKAFCHIFKMTSPDHLTLTVDQHIGYTNNHVYEAAETYLRTIINPTTNRLKVSKTEGEKKFTISIEKGEEIEDTCNGVSIKWKYVVEDPEKDPSRHSKYSFEIVFEKKFKDMILGSYLPYIMERSEAIKKEDKVVKLHARGGDSDDDWGSVRMEHPVTFDKLAMDPEQKKTITDDLDRFLRRKEFYQRIGKVWKRGYLLYGPPGTGKSSLIAAMANYLKFDIYDLKLSSIDSDSKLRSILMSISNRSILIIEDIDCNAKVQDRALSDAEDQSNSKLTLSGLLNFLDGIWSSCGDERIIVVTTNYKERMDPALLRPGRMDLHIHLSYCTPAGFRILAKNYLGLTDHAHPLLEEIERLLIDAKATPAEVSEELLRSENPEIALNGVISFLNQKINEPPQPEKRGLKRDREKETSKLNTMTRMRQSKLKMKKRAEMF